MAWKWFWNTETKYYDEVITRETDWGGDASTENLPVSGGRVQEWLKTEINGRYGFLNMRFNEGESMYYIECFTNESDYLLYNSDKEANKDLLLQSVQIPISTVQGDAFTAMLRTNMSNTANIVVTDDKLEVELNYRAIKITQIGNENAGYNGSLVVQTSTNGETWNTMGTIPNCLPSSDPEDTNTYTTVDIGKYLVSGKQMVRLRATYTYTNEDGEKKTINSSNVIIGGSVTKTSLKLELVTNYEQPMSAHDVNGNANPFSVTYAVYGSAQKTHYVKIDGGTPITYTYDASVDSVNKTVSASVESYMTHGVHKVETWLECEDGLGNTLKSNVLVNRFMVVNEQTSGADLTKPYLLLQNVDSTIDNFVQTEIAEYAVYNPSGENVDVAFLLTEYSENYETTKPEEYFRLEVSVEPNTPNKLLTTIEIENEDEGTEITKYDTYFRVRRTSGGTSTDFMYESTGERTYYVIVDNSNAYTPVSGATFLMNPKVRNNSESNPKRILNAKNNNTEVDSVWTNFGFINDGWMNADDGQKVLRVMAGSTLEIKRNVWRQFLTNPNSSMTFEIDFKVDNVTNTTDPIVKMFEGSASSFKGLCLNALEGWIMNASNNTKDNCLFSWEEGKRVHLSINLHHQVKPNKGDVKFTEDNATKANGVLALARVILNGDPVREVPFSVTNANEWCSSTNGSIIIGNEGADIDIYSIRIYENKVVEMTDILNRNYLASLPTSEQKIALHSKNDLLDGGRISLEKTKNKGLNCMVWHGVLPYHANQAEQKGWVELWRYDQDGKYLPEYSGTICKETKSLTGKGQGSTAKTYYDWNLQEDSSKVKDTIQVSLNDIHSEIIVGSPYTASDGKQYVDIYGGHLGKNAPIEIPENAQPYPYTNGMVTVPDGWIDGNGMYRGMGYRVAEGTSLAQKRVIKINYASSMQSHLIGACNTYDLLHRKVVGNTPLQEVIPDAVSAKRTEPFMFFNQEEGDNNVYFKGMGTYGAGKADKVTWGFVKKQMPMYALIEGSDNNLPMTGFRVPFDKNTAVYDVGGEGWLYNGQQSFDFDLGNTDDNDVPTDAITQRWADIHNFIYLHSTNLKYYNGTYEEFLKSSAAEDTNYKYWCTQGGQAFNLKRYDFINDKWIDAGLLYSFGYGSFSLKNSHMTTSAYNEWVNNGTGDYAILNQAFIDSIVADMRKRLKYFINEKSLQFNYCYVLGFLAGTDNSDKNTYYKIDPIGVEMEYDKGFASEFKAIFGHDFDFTSVHQLYFDGDDMDSIFRTNNNSHQTKPYYIDRMHPNADGSTTSLYEGMGNQLFNFVEKAYESTGELSAMMNQIMIAATELVGEDDKLYGLESGKVSLWGFLHKYFFNIQYYFPQIAYMEQARIRYEFPKLIGFISSGGGARNIDPITQSLGSQLYNELQYMNQRVIYMTSYAAFGAWGGDTTHSIGLSDANETFSFVPALMPDGSPSTYTFTITPHQYIYPSHYYGGTFTSTRQRTSPNQTCTFTIAKNVQGSDTGMGICGINYYTDLGDMSRTSIVGDFTIVGKRLNVFRAAGRWVSLDNHFRVTSITINTTSLKKFIAAGIPELANVNLQACVRCSEISVASTGIKNVITPKSYNLKSLYCGPCFATQTYSLEINDAPNLEKINCVMTSAMTSLYVHPNVGTNTGLSLQSLATDIYTNQKSQSTPNLQEISIQNVNWTDFPAETLEWYCDIPKCEFKGTISIKEDDQLGLPRITWDLKNKINAKFGNVDSNNNDLRLTYKQRDVDPDGLKLLGNYYSEGNTTVHFQLRPSSLYQNTQQGFYFFWDNGNIDNVSLHPNNGIMTLYGKLDTERTAILNARVYFKKNANGQTSGTVKKEILLWNRPAQLGDLVYADGTFSSAASWDGEKTPIGICFYVPPRDKDGNILTKFNNPNDKQLRLMVALEETKVSINGTLTSSLQWGCMSPFDANSDAQYALYDTDSTGKKVNLTSSAVNKVPNVYDIQAVRNLTVRGLDNAYIDPDPTTNENKTESDYRDIETTDGVLNDGFKCITPDMAVGDGFAYNESQMPFNSIGERTLTSELAKLAGSGYKENDLVNSGYAKTLKIIAHRNNLLNNDIIGADGEVIYQGGLFPLPSASGGVSEMRALGTLIDQLRTWASQASGLNDPYPTKWQQMAYPFVSACYAYQPTQTLQDGEVLADKFKAHNWFAPTEGHIIRICWYAKYGTKGNFDAFKGARDKGLLGTLTTSSSSHWSVTEFSSGSSWYVYFINGNAGSYFKSSSFVGRAVSAF